MNDTQTNMSFVDNEAVPDTLSTREAAEFLGLNISTVKKRARQGALKRTDNGRITRESILEYERTNPYLVSRRQAAQSLQKAKPERGRKEQMVPVSVVSDILNQVMARQERFFERVIAVQRATARDLTRQMIAEQRTTARDFTRQMTALFREQVREAKREAKTEAQKAAQRPRTTPTGAILPQPGSRIERIYDHLVEVDRAQRADQVKQALNLSDNLTSIRRDLDKLVERQLAIRVRPGLYQVKTLTESQVKTLTERQQSNTEPHITTLERVFQTIRDAEQPISPKEIQQALGMRREVSAELTQLFRRGRIERVAQENPMASRYRVRQAVSELD